MLVSFSDQLVVLAQKLFDLLAFRFLLDHSIENATFPIEIEAFEHHEVIIWLVMREK